MNAANTETLNLPQPYPGRRFFPFLSSPLVETRLANGGAPPPMLASTCAVSCERVLFRDGSYTPAGGKGSWGERDECFRLQGQHCRGSTERCGCTAMRGSGDDREHKRGRSNEPIKFRRSHPPPQHQHIR